MMEMTTIEKWDAQTLYRLATKKNWPILYSACTKYSSLLSLVVSPNGDTISHLAVEFAPNPIAMDFLKLMSRNIRIDAINKEGNNLLHLAASRGDIDIFRKVFAYSKLDIKKKNGRNRTALFMAVFRGKSVVFDPLFRSFMDEYNVDPNQPGLLEDCIDLERDTILHVAIRNGFMDLAEKIVMRVPHLIEIENKKGETPLHILSKRKAYFMSTSTDGREQADKVIKSKLVLLHILQHYWGKRDGGELDEWNPWKKTRNSLSGEVGEVKVLPSPIVFAIKKEIPEIVEGIVDFFPGVLEDQSGGKLIIILAAERRNVRIMTTLIKSVMRTSMFDVKEGVDNILHIAAKFYDYQPWRELDVYVQMQMEINWFDFVKALVPEHFQHQENAKGNLPIDVFNTTHKDLVKKGAEWIESVASIGALGAAVLTGGVISGFATTPGGTDEKGIPHLAHSPGYKIFNVCSLLAIMMGWLCLTTFYNVRFASSKSKFSKKITQGLLCALVISHLVAAAALTYTAFGKALSQHIGLSFTGFMSIGLGVFFFLFTSYWQHEKITNLYRSSQTKIEDF